MKQFLQCLCVLTLFACSAAWAADETDKDSQAYREASEACFEEADTKAGDDPEAWDTLFNACMERHGISPTELDTTQGTTGGVVEEPATTN